MDTVKLIRHDMPVAAVGNDWILSTDSELLSAGEQQIGGKAMGLTKLKAAGARVPPWFSITANCFSERLAAADLLEPLRKLVCGTSAAPGFEEERIAEIQKQITALSFDSGFLDHLCDALESIGPGPFAVRSSMAGEDSANFSYAGQLESFLYQRSVQDVARAICACWASSLSARVLAYRQNAGADTALPRMAVVVQKMISGQVSGVAFSAHPTSGVRDQVLINATWGLGEGVVGGHCNADDYCCTHDGQEVEVKLADKDLALIEPRGNSTGTEEVEVHEDRRKSRCLSTDQVGELSAEVCRIASLLGCPQDIEWTIDGEQIYLLQSRPITSLPLPPNEDGPQHVFDNSNIQESYCGVTTPLTFSFAARAYQSVYNQTMRAVGMPDSFIRLHQERHRHLLGLVHGRVYYNINNWYEGLLLLPGFGRNKADMEKMMGLTDPVDFVVDQQLSRIQKIRHLPRLLATAFRLFRAFSSLDRDVPQWLLDFERAYARLDRQRFASASFSELMQWLQQLEDEVLASWHTPIINDFAVMISNGRLRRLVAKSGISNPDVVIQQLLGGESGIESTEPTRLLMRMANMIRQQPELVAVFQNQKSSIALEEIKNHPGLAEMFNHYIERYGDRSMGELKLETRSLREDPGFVIEILKNYIARTDLDPDKLAAQELRHRIDAERLLRQHLNLSGRMCCKRVLRAARCSIKHRENMRLARTRAFGLARDLYRALGQRLVDSKQLAEIQDIFFLTVEEIRDYFKGRAVTTNLRGLTALRKEEYEQHEKQPLPHQFTTRGPVYFGNRYSGPPIRTDELNGHRLKGTGCYPGVIESGIKMIRDPGDNLSIDGQILVAERTDPGWAPLFPTCSGILVERGSTLSHSAVIARELGIPAVVGVANLFAIVKQGERIRLDGGTGSIELLDRMTPGEHP